MAHPLITICVVTYNHSKYIKKCLESILSNDYENIEVIVSDDGSVDGNIEEIKKFKDSRLTLLQSERQGPSFNLNAAIQKGKGLFTLTFSGDDEMLPHCIRKKVELIK